MKCPRCTVKDALLFCKSEQSSEKSKPKGYPLEPKTLGEHIRKRRMDLKLFQHQVAEQLGVDKCTIHNWERNFSSPDPRLVPGIIEFLGTVPSRSQFEGEGDGIPKHKIG
jgi:DNA-binding transcriptional regulator YiaG